MKYHHQTGQRISISRDRRRHALTPGWRISKTGHRYFEGRKNRSDLAGSNL